MKKDKLLKISAVLTSALAALAALPYELGQAAIVIPPTWKQPLAIIGIAATVILRICGQAASK